MRALQPNDADQPRMTARSNVAQALTGVVGGDLVIVNLARARVALRDAKTIQETKKVLDVAAAAEIYATRQSLGQEAIDFAHAIKIEALRQLGSMLKETPRNTGVKLAGRDFFGGTKSEPPKISAPSLSDLGIDKKTSSIAQKLAALPPAAFEEVKAGHVAVAKAIVSVEKAKKPIPDSDHDLRAQLDEARDTIRDLSEASRDFEDRLTAYEKTEPDEQQKEIMRLQKRVAKLENEIERITVVGNDMRHKNNELIREVKRLQRRLGAK